MTEPLGSVEDLMAYLGQDTGMDALNEELSGGTSRIFDIDRGRLVEVAHAARACLQTSEGADLFRLLKMEVVEGVVFAPFGPNGLGRPMEQIAAEGLFREGRRNMISMILMLAASAEQIERELERDED